MPGRLTIATRTALAATALLLAVGAPAHAQALAQISADDRIRVKSTQGSGTFTVLENRGHSLVVARGRGDTLELPLAAMQRLSVEGEPRTAGAGAARGAGIGALIGGSLGVALGLAAGDDTEGFVQFSAPEKAMALGLIMGGGGLLGGLIIGALSPGTRWDPVELRQRVVVAPSAGGRISIGYAVAF
jgi:hypothetical protein